MKNPHHWIRYNFMRFGQLSNFGVCEAFDLATIVQWSKKYIVDGRWAFEVGEKRNSKFGLQMNCQNLHIQCHLQTRPKKKASYFYCSRACCWGPAPPRILLPTSPSKLEIFFLVAIAVTLSIAFLPPIGDTCKSHVNVHGHCDKIYHQLMATQVKFPRESLATEAAHSLRHALHRSQVPKHLGPTLSIFGFLLAPTY